MNINTITAEDLRRMPDKEGLILQGCGGDLTEWVDGINEMLTKAGILKDGCQFENVAAFQHGELTCLLYPFDDVKLDIGKLALWRLQTHEVYGGTWLSDFVPNYLGGFIETPEALADKPDCPLIGADGNIFNLLGIASRTLREHGLKEQAKEMSDRVFVSGSYGEALCIIGEYVNITDSELEHKNSLRQQLKATKPADPVKKQQTSKQPFQAPESYLRNAELYEEGQTGNYNMLDGRLNNEPPVRPDLTDGQTDEEIRELVPEAKPSLMDRLKADKPEHEARQMIPPVPERER